MKNIKNRSCQNIWEKNKLCQMSKHPCKEQKMYRTEKVFRERTEYENTGKEYNMLKFQQSTVIIIQLTHSNQTKEHCVLRQC